MRKLGLAGLLAAGALRLIGPAAGVRIQLGPLAVCWRVAAVLGSRKFAVVDRPYANAA